MSETSTINPPVCDYCGQHHKFKCPMVKSIEYYENSLTKRVEFFSPNEFPELKASYPPFASAMAYKK